MTEMEKSGASTCYMPIPNMRYFFPMSMSFKAHHRLTLNGLLPEILADQENVSSAKEVQRQKMLSDPHPNPA